MSHLIRLKNCACVWPLAALLVLPLASLFMPLEARQPLLNSLFLAAGAVAISLPLGGLLATLLLRYDLPGRRAAAASLGVLLFLPLYVQLSGWDAAFGKLGWYSLASGALAEPFLAGMRGAIFVHGIAAIPWVALIVGIGLLEVDSSQEEAALLVAPPRIVLWRITLRQNVPFIVAAAIWTLVSTTSEMTVTNIYLINPREWTYTERFYMSFVASEAGPAAVDVLPGVVGLSVIIGITLYIIDRLAKRRLSVIAARPVTFSSGGWKPVTTAALWVLVITLIGIPVASLIAKAGFVVMHRDGKRIASWSANVCMGQIAAVPRRFGNEFRGTTAVAIGAASLALVTACFLAWRARRRRWWQAVATGAVVLGLAIPGPLVGAALIQMLNHDLPPEITFAGGPRKSWLLLLYDETPLAPILAQTIRALPLVIMLLWYSFAALSDDVLAAAALDGLSPGRVFWKIAVPQRWRAIVAAWIAAFAIAAGDLAWAHLVTPPGLDLLQRRVFGLVHSGVEEQVAAISLVVMMAFAVLVAADWILFRLPTDASTAAIEPQRRIA